MKSPLIDPRISFLGCPLDLLTPEALLEEAEQVLRQNRHMRLEGLNVAKLVDARNQPELLLALEQAERVHIDGAGISLGLKYLKLLAPARRAGIDLLGDLCALAVRLDTPIYLLGGRAHVVSLTAERLQSRYPGLRIAGVRDGYFDAAEEEAVVEDIRNSGARLLFIGISSPKKELFLRTHWANLGVNIGMGVGGSFDVLSGQLPRAPRWMQRCGLEWCFRFALEPRRLGWRYVRTNSVFGLLLLTAKLKVMAPRQAESHGNL